MVISKGLIISGKIDFKKIMMKDLLIILYPFIKLVKHDLKQKTIKKLSIFLALIKLALLKRSNKQSREVRVRMGPYTITSPDYATLSFLIKEKFVDEQYYFEQPHTRPVIFDCGSSIGISVLYFKSLYPSSEIYSFEPHPVAFNFLKSNVCNNNLTGVHCYNIALSGGEHSIDFFIPKQNSFINSKAYKDELLEYQTIKVPAKPLSEFLMQFEKVDLVKIDVEGSELDIFADLQKEVLKRKIVRKFIIEYHSQIHPAKPTLENFLTIFKVNGYEYKILNSDKNDDQADKLICVYLQE
jgi:FkbM family methyltransferase